MAHATVGFPGFAALINAVLASRVIAFAIAAGWALAVLFAGPVGVEEEAGVVV